MSIRDDQDREAGGLVDVIERLGTTPLTDPRSLATSTLLHVLIVLAASLTVMNVAATRDDSQVAGASRRDRAGRQPSRPEAESGAGGGGSPGEIGGLGDKAFAQDPGAAP